MNDTIIFSVFADLHWREGDWTWCEARLDAIFARALRERAEFIIHHAYPPELMAKCHVSNHTLINAEPVHAIVRMDMDGAVEIEGMRGAPYLGVTQESLGMDAFGRHGFPFTFHVLSAKFSL